MSQQLLGGDGFRHPSPVYIFVVLSLAAFLAMFVIWRDTEITYRVQTSIHQPELDGRELSAVDVDRESRELRRQILAPEFVLQGLQDAGMVSEVPSEEELVSVRKISQRMHATVVSRLGHNEIEVGILTPKPMAGQIFLDSLTGLLAEKSGMLPSPARVVSRRGGSVVAGQLLSLGVLSACVGLIGVWFAARSRPTEILQTEQEIVAVTGAPVIASFVEDGALARAQNREFHRSTFRIAVLAAELGIAAVFFLMIFQFATQEAFFNRFYHDPFAAYGELLTRFIG